MAKISVLDAYKKAVTDKNKDKKVKEIKGSDIAPLGSMMAEATALTQFPNATILTKEAFEIDLAKNKAEKAKLREETE
jgi:hypothetical protein